MCHGSELLTSEEAMNRLREQIKKPQGNKEKKRAESTKKNKKKRKLSSSSEDNEPESPPCMDSDNSEEFWQEIENNTNDENEDIDQTITPTSWVLVEYHTKKTTNHFVGKVTEACDDGWMVKFTRFSKNTFSWPEAVDSDIV
ncbi:uncharacterized protein [Leptinotarsa decemlineata]|uniref:uncharacterized protein n=1 Tax=Leptinotarsa decemlineata TaxID=7539 RepID=UPI003D308A41